MFLYFKSVAVLRRCMTFSSHAAIFFVIRNVDLHRTYVSNNIYAAHIFLITFTPHIYF